MRSKLATAALCASETIKNLLVAKRLRFRNLIEIGLWMWQITGMRRSHAASTTSSFQLKSFTWSKSTLRRPSICTWPTIRLNASSTRRRSSGPSARWGLGRGRATGTRGRRQRYSVARETPSASQAGAVSPGRGAFDRRSPPHSNCIVFVRQFVHDPRRPLGHTDGHESRRVPEPHLPDSRSSSKALSTESSGSSG